MDLTWLWWTLGILFVVGCFLLSSHFGLIGSLRKTSQNPDADPQTRKEAEDIMRKIDAGKL